MKKIATFIFLISFGWFSKGTAQTITIGSAQDVFVDSNRPTEDLSTKDEINAYTWTLSGNPVKARTVIKFDLSAIPPNVIITSAKLKLYAHPSPVYATPTSHVGENALTIHTIDTNQLNFATTNWNNQPKESSSSYVLVPASATQKQNYEIELVNLFQDLNKASNGFSIRLANETPFSSVSFASSEFADPTKRPSLEITYIKGQTLTLNSNDCKDVFVDSNRPTEDLSKVSEINAYTWTLSGNMVSGRFYINFNMNALPINANIESAYLYLFHNASPVYASPTSHSGENDLIVERVTTNWVDNLTNWNNQPSTTDSNSILLPKSTYKNQDYVINVTQLIKDMKATNTFNGLKIRSKIEEPFKSISFASSENTDINKRPKLIVNYQYPTGFNDNELKLNFSFFPNPSQGVLNFDFEDSKNKSIRFFDLNGALIFEKIDIIQKDLSIPTNFAKSSGLYLMEVVQNDKSSFHKIIIN